MPLMRQAHFALSKSQKGAWDWVQCAFKLSMYSQVDLNTYFCSENIVQELCSSMILSGLFYENKYGCSNN